MIIDARHISGDHPESAGDLFPSGTTRTELESVADDIVRKGTRISDPQKRIQSFEMHTTINGHRQRVRVTVDADDGNRIITMHPVTR